MPVAGASSTAAVQPAVLAIVAGLFAGLALSVGLNTVVAQWSIGNLNDPVVLVAVSLVLCVVTMMSAAIPANRAASIQPADALRIDSLHAWPNSDFSRSSTNSPGRPRNAFRRRRPLVRSLVETQWAADFVPTLLLIFAASMLLLLLACANVSILLLARGTSRAHEFAVRAAIGASRGRLMRQLLVESLLLAFNGAALGVAAGYWGLPAMLRRLPPNSVPVGNLIAVPVNIPVLLFSAGLAMASALMFGLSPALSCSRPRLTATARTTAGVEIRRAHHLLLAAQIALTVLLLAGTGAAVRALIGLYRTSLGLRSAQCDHRVDQPSREQSHGMGRPRHVL